MLVTNLNAHCETTARYDELARAVANRYGDSAQALVFVLYEELIAMRRLLAQEPATIAVAARIARIREQVQRLYDLSTFDDLTHAPIRRVAQDPVITEYDRTVFDRRYRAAVAAVQAETVALAGAGTVEVEPGRAHMFVIDDERRLLVWRRPFRFDDLVFGRNRATVEGVPVAHPMLVPERLRAMAAGEIVFIGAPRPSAIVVNTKSGHFRPPPSSGEVIRDVLQAVFGLGPDRVDLFVVPLPTMPPPTVPLTTVPLPAGSQPDDDAHDGGPHDR